MWARMLNRPDQGTMHSWLCKGLSTFTSTSCWISCCMALLYAICTQFGRQVSEACTEKVLLHNSLGMQ